MIDVIERNRERIADLCRRYGVRRLDLFGSAARGDDFDPATSDVDFLVEFLSYEVPSIADDWFELQEGLADLLGHPADLTSIRAATDPLFLVVANQHRTTLYAAGEPQAVG